MTGETHHVAVSVAGTLSCVDSSGVRPMTDAEFSDVIWSMADHLDDEAGITDPSVWGQASTGDMKVRFYLRDSAGLPVLDGTINNIIARLTDAVGLLWANNPRPPVAEDASVKLLAATSQHLDLVPATT